MNSIRSQERAEFHLAGEARKELQLSPDCQIRRQRLDLREASSRSKVGSYFSTTPYPGSRPTKRL